MASDRPVCVTVIGWGTIAVATLAVFSGVMGTAMSSIMPEAPPRTGAPESIDFVFAHFEVFAFAQALVGVLLVFAGRSLLRLRKWASRVIETVAWLLLLYAVVFTFYFGRESVTAFSEATNPIPLGFVVTMGVMTVFSLAFWAVPLILTIRNLRSKRVRDVLV